MITVESSMHVPGMRAARVVHFMTNPTDAAYREWWPGTHLAMHPLNDISGAGQIVCMDEFVGDRRLRFRCILTDRAPDRVIWQFVKGIKLPCWLSLHIQDDSDGATITHTIRAGFSGAFGQLLDPILRLYFSKDFASTMDAHFTHEFAVLPSVLERLESEASA